MSRKLYILSLLGLIHLRDRWFSVVPLDCGYVFVEPRKKQGKISNLRFRI